MMALIAATATTMTTRRAALTAAATAVATVTARSIMQAVYELEREENKELRAAVATLIGQVKKRRGDSGSDADAQEVAGGRRAD